MNGGELMVLPHAYEIASKYRSIRTIIVPLIVAIVLFLPPFTPMFSEVKIEIILGLSVAMLLIIWDLMAGQFKPIQIQAFANADMAQEMLKIVMAKNKKQANAWVIQYSGENSHDVIKYLNENNLITKVDMLLKKPDTAINAFQSGKVQKYIDSMPVYFQSPSKIKVRCYREPGSVRGILIEDVALCIGWYIYEDVPNSNRQNCNEETWIWGHNTGALLVLSDSEAFKPLCEFFMRTFAYLSDETKTDKVEKQGMLKF